MATIDPAVIANARQAETIKHLNMYNILNNIRIAANKTTFPYDGLVPQNIQFKKANVTINTINPTGAKPTQNIKPNKQSNKLDKHHTNNTQNVKTGGKHRHTDEKHTDDSDSDNAHNHRDNAHNGIEILFFQ